MRWRHRFNILERVKMPEFKPSAQQQAAVETDGSALLISAAAGSGKTTVLVRRVLRLLCDTNPEHTADRLMVVTFTVAAAAKLKGDLSHKLTMMINEGEHDSGLLKKQRMLLPRATIGTFDSFCKNLCTEFFAKLLIEPDFKVGERLMLDIIEQEAMSVTMNRMLQEEDFALFASNFANPRSLEEPQNAIKMLHRRMTSRPFPSEYIKQQQQSADPKRELGKTPAGEVLFSHAKATLSTAKKSLEKAITLATDYGATDKAIELLIRERNFIERLIEQAESFDYNGIKETFSQGPSGRGRKFDTFLLGKLTNEGVGELIKQLRNMAKELSNDLYEQSFICEYEKICEQHHRMVSSLCEATLFYHETLFELKKEASCFDFYDLQHMAAGLIRDEQLRLTERYFAIMVDEYQDTNPIADYIYHSLAAKNPAAIFLVGDVKQSIYGFNSARPDIFADRVEHAELGDDSKVIYLSKNYRSSAEVINNVNDLFSLVMSKKLGGIDYDENNRLYLGRQDSSPGSVELMVCEEDDSSSVAALCEQLITQGTPAEDICILVQTNKAVAEYAAVINEFGLSGEVAGDKSLSEEAGVMPLIALLRFLANPFSEVDLIAVLLSPLAGFTADEVAKLYIDKHTRLILAMAQSQSEKVKSFTKVLWELHAKATSVSVRLMLQEIYEQLNGYVICCSMSCGAPSAIAEIEELAVQYDRVGRNGITGFVRRLNIVLESSNRKSRETTTRRGFVNVMTIHNSKGLEFPICILAGTAKYFNSKEQSSSVLQQDSSAIGMKVFNGEAFIETPFRRAAAIATAKELQSERMRLLYVAATRAMQKLYIFTTAKQKKITALAGELYAEGGITPNLLERQKSFSDIIMLYTLCHPCADMLRANCIDIPLTTVEMAGNLKINFCEKQQPRIKEQRKGADIDLCGYSELFSWKYHNEQDTKKPIKHSVTELLEKTQQLPPTPVVPKFSNKNESGAIRGSATHAFLQLCRLPLPKEKVEEEIARLVEEGFMDKEQAALVNLFTIKRFLSGKLAKRIADAESFYREYEFITEHKEMVIQGVVDLILVEADCVVVVDYKTTRADENELREMYKDQLLLYATAVERRLNRPIKQRIIYSLSLGKELEV